LGREETELGLIGDVRLEKRSPLPRSSLKKLRLRLGKGKGRRTKGKEPVV